MRGLSDTITRLSRMRTSAANPQPVGDPLKPLGLFGSNPGALDAQIHVPRSLEPKPALVVVLHGCMQAAADYDIGSGWSRLADDHGFIVLYPQQRRANNANLCFNWFQPGDIIRGEGEALSIRQMIQHVVDMHRIDRRRVFVSGLSAGGAMTNVMLATYPEVFAAGAVIAGLPYGVAASVPQAFDCMRGHGIRDVAHLQSLLHGASSHQGSWPSISIWHGTADQTVDVANAGAIAQQWMGVLKLEGHNSTLEGRADYSSQTWKDAAGGPAIRIYTIPGMAHGTPIDAASGYGYPAPFMLDQGVSSTQLIAQTWSLTPGLNARDDMVEVVDPKDFPEISADAGDLVKPQSSGIETLQARL